MKHGRGWKVGIIVLGWSMGCGEMPDGDAVQGLPAHQEAEKWGANERPRTLSDGMKYRVDQLPREGTVTRMPWPGSHWPMQNDAINARWDGPDSMSAVEKLGRAIGRPDLETRVSSYYGLDSLRGEKSCTKDAQCPRHKSKCGIRRGATRGRCVGDWWGVCHAWSPASIGEPEPQHPVVYNGVEFKVNDIKALLTLAYAQSRCTQLGKRSELWRFKTDATGRPMEEALRQVNAGTFHVAMTNVVGLRGLSMTLDRDLSYRVFNHPVAAYKVMSHKQVDVAEAKRLLGVSSWRYPYASGVAAFYQVSMEVSLVMDTHDNEDGPLVPNIERYLDSHVYSYLLEVDKFGSITGGEWLGNSRLHHPDFIWMAKGPSGTHRAGGAVAVATILELAAMSRAP